MPHLEPMPIPATDRSLIHRIQGGESDAATLLYHRYAERLRVLTQNQIGTRLAQRVEAEDVVQSVFRTFFRRVALGEYDIPAGEELWGLFLVIGLNKVRAEGVRHAAAKRDVRRTRALSAVHNEIARPDPNETVLIDVIEDLLQRLPQSHQQIVTKRIEGHSVEEIATSVSRSKRTVERVLQQFRKQLSDQITAEL